MAKQQRKLWEHPWSYKESFIIAFAVMLTGFLIEFFSGGKGIAAPSYPANVIGLIAFLNIIIIAHIFFRDAPLVKWLGRIPAAISAISIFTLLILMMGFTLQEDAGASDLVKRLGLSHVTSSWAYLLVEVYFLTALAFVTIRKVWPFKVKNIGFLLNHLGLFITILAATMGSGDLMRMRMNLYEGKTTFIATDYSGQNYEMPFAFHLNDFKIIEYPPKVGLVSNITGEIDGPDQEAYFEIEEGFTAQLGDIEYKVLQFFPDAMKIDSKYVEFQGEGSVPAAFIGVFDNKGDTLKTGWLSCGNAYQKGTYFSLSEENSLVMLSPTAKKYSSDVVLRTEEGADSLILEVNKPIKVNGWKVYQLGYDENLGKHSPLSVLEVVRDPWIIWVYIGIFMVVAGAFYIFWIGRKEKINTEKSN